MMVHTQVAKNIAAPAVLSLIITVALFQPARADWQELTGTSVSPSERMSWSPSITEASDGLWAIWEYGNYFDGHYGSYGISAARYDESGNRWIGVANVVDAVRNHLVADPEIESVNGDPWVAWSEGERHFTSVRVARYDRASGSWQRVGPQLNSSPYAHSASIVAVRVRGIEVPYVVWEEWSPGSYPWRVRVARYDQARQRWTRVGAAVNQPNANGPQYPAIAAINDGENDVPYVSWRQLNESGYDWEQYVARFDGEIWIKVGGQLNTRGDQYLVESGLTGIDDGSHGRGQTPYVVLREHLYNIRVVRLDRQRGRWEQVGQPLSNFAYAVRIVNISGRPWVSLTRIGYPWQVELYRLDESSNGWKRVGSYLNAAIGKNGLHSYPAAVDGFPMVAWADGDYNIRVSRLAPEFLDTDAKPALTSAKLTATVRTYGLPFRVGFQYGKGFTRSTAMSMADGDIATVEHQINDLEPATEYPYRPIADVGAGPLVFGPERSFITNRPPICVNQEVRAVAAEPIRVYLKCSDPDGDTLALSIERGPAGGSLSEIDQTLSVLYTSGQQTVDDSFTYVASDGYQFSAPATVKITVQQKPRPGPDNGSDGSGSGSPSSGSGSKGGDDGGSGSPAPGRSGDGNGSGSPLPGTSNGGNGRSNAGKKPRRKRPVKKAKRRCRKACIKVHR